MEEAEFRLGYGNMAKSYKAGFYTDVCFVVGGVRLTAHRCVVAAASPVLHAMLAGATPGPAVPSCMHATPRRYCHTHCPT
jgi:hypothetical protein